MSTPFICQRCIGRLSRLQNKQLKPNFQLHTQAAAAPTSGSQPIWSPSEERQRFAVKDDFPIGNRPKPPSCSRGLDAQQLQYEAGVKTTPRWDGHVKKFTPRRRPLLADRMPVRSPRDLKSKILASLGNYNVVYDDIIRFYGLTREETRHAVTQLERLLWGRDSLEEAAIRLDLYHEWKTNFKDLLRKKGGSLETNTTFDQLIMKDAWHRLDHQRRASLWPQTILSVLRTSPGTLPSFIQSSFHSTSCPSYILEDATYLLFQISDSEIVGRAGQEQLTELVFFLLENSPPRYISLEQTIIRKVMSWLPTLRVLELYEALKTVEHPLHWNTSLHFASCFAQHSMYKAKAASLLHSLRYKRGFDINSPAAASVCTTLLNLKAEDKLPDDEAAPDELFKLLLDLGFRPNLLGLSALMRNFCVRGRVEVAWNIFNLLIQRRIQPDVQVFSILLNGAKEAVDVESLQRVVNAISASKSWSPYLINDLLDSIYQMNEFHNKSERSSRTSRKENCKMAWRFMVQIYTKFFRLAPLQKLTRYPLENLLVLDVKKQLPAHLSQMDRLAATLAPLPDRLLMQPGSITLSLMFKAHLRSIKSLGPLRAYYHLFKELLRKGDRTVVNLVKDHGTAIFNIFLRDFLQFRSSVRDGLQILHEATIEHRRYSKDIRHPSQLLRTYTILMNGLRNHRHPQLVIVTLVRMIKEGITPNITTWNVVIGTLLRENHIREAVRVMQHMEQIGLETNQRTVREITRLSHSKRVRIAQLKEKLGKNRTNLDDLSLAKSLLHILRRKPSEISMKRAREINRQYREAGESSEEPLLEKASNEQAIGTTASA
ncbi:hypothetical protein F4820DRAFT_439903 [Hypoxylon rubiginosum]|uniref:Uncharacterized protein n=1 Tax=Hypoxylon rubiginosum TaxID=110542 RepID=A0ACB9YJF6_9PEZI|nr:hypothetical protein F4820DRAFT_439903 [Hypoxylon rubiginosum]